MSPELAIVRNYPRLEVVEEVPTLEEFLLQGIEHPSLRNSAIRFFKNVSQPSRDDNTIVLPFPLLAPGKTDIYSSVISEARKGWVGSTEKKVFYPHFETVYDLLHGETEAILTVTERENSRPIVSALRTPVPPQVMERGIRFYRAVQNEILKKRGKKLGLYPGLLYS